MLRTTVIAVVAAALAVTIAVAAFAAAGVLAWPWGLGLWLGLQLGILYLALRFERIRYKPLDAEAPPGFAATPERFIDPSTGAEVQVWFDAATGERRYVTKTGEV